MLFVLRRCHAEFSTCPSAAAPAKFVEQEKRRPRIGTALQSTHDSPRNTGATVFSLSNRAASLPPGLFVKPPFVIAHLPYHLVIFLHVAAFAPCLEPRGLSAPSEIRGPVAAPSAPHNRPRPSTQPPQWDAAKTVLLHQVARVRAQVPLC